MKKFITIFSILLFTLSNYSQFGIKAAYASAKPKLTMAGGSISGAATSGFTFGITKLSEISDNLKWGIDLTYSSYSSDGSSTGSFDLPLYIQYYTSGEGLYLKGGAFYRSLTEDMDEGFKKGAFGLGLGIGYDFNDSFGAELGYDLQLSDQLKDVDGASYKLPVLRLGVKYLF